MVGRERGEHSRWGDGAAWAQRGACLVPGLGSADSLGCLSDSFRDDPVGEALKGFSGDMRQARGGRNLTVPGFVAGLNCSLLGKESCGKAGRTGAGCELQLRKFALQSRRMAWGQQGSLSFRTLARGAWARPEEPGQSGKGECGLRGLPWCGPREILEQWRVC